MKKTITRTVSTIAMSAIASILGGIAAQAADLGGNCCADLEERVAELEATAARKGNRKVSLTVSGFVNEAVMFWNDGTERNAYVVSNNMGATRMRFNGAASISSDLSAGYLLEISWRYANSSDRNQNADSAGGNANKTDIRHSAWWVDSKSLGRLWVGHTSGANDDITTISVANIVSSAAIAEPFGGNFRLRVNGKMSNNAIAPLTAPVTSLTWNSLYNQATGFNGEGGKNNVVKYVTPSLGGFIASASWGEDDRIDVALRYAGVMSGFKIAAGIGYGVVSDTGAIDNAVCANLASAGATKTLPNAATSAVSCRELGMSGGIMHLASGLFVDGSYGINKDNNRAALYAASGYTKSVNDSDKSWYLRGGVEQKWTALGRTTLYAEALKHSTGAALNIVPLNASGSGFIRDVTGDGILGAGAARIMSSEVKMWGIGFNQEIAAASMDVYVSYKNFKGSAQTDTAVGAAAGTTKVQFDGFQAIMTGALIRF
jgi:hypothetical protein